MKKLFFIYILFFSFSAKSQTNLSGEQCGILSSSFSPYILTDNIYVPENCSLTIEAGVTLTSDKPNNFTAKGEVYFNGSESNRINISGFISMSFQNVTNFDYVDIQSNREIKSTYYTNSFTNHGSNGLSMSKLSNENYLGYDDSYSMGFNSTSDSIIVHDYLFTESETQYLSFYYYSYYNNSCFKVESADHLINDTICSDFDIDRGYWDFYVIEIPENQSGDINIKFVDGGDFLLDNLSITNYEPHRKLSINFQDYYNSVFCNSDDFDDINIHFSFSDNFGYSGIVDQTGFFTKQNYRLHRDNVIKFNATSDNEENIIVYIRSSIDASSELLFESTIDTVLIDAGNPGEYLVNLPDSITYFDIETQIDTTIETSSLPLKFGFRTENQQEVFIDNILIGFDDNRQIYFFQDFDSKSTNTNVLFQDQTGIQSSDNLIYQTNGFNYGSMYYNFYDYNGEEKYLVSSEFYVNQTNNLFLNFKIKPYNQNYFASPSGGYGYRLHVQLEDSDDWILAYETNYIDLISDDDYSKLYNQYYNIEINIGNLIPSYFQQGNLRFKITSFNDKFYNYGERHSMGSYDNIIYLDDFIVSDRPFKQSIVSKKINFQGCSSNIRSIYSNSLSIYNSEILSDLIVTNSDSLIIDSSEIRHESIFADSKDIAISNCEFINANRLIFSSQINQEGSDKDSIRVDFYNVNVDSLNYFIYIFADELSFNSKYSKYTNQRENYDNYLFNNGLVNLCSAINNNNSVAKVSNSLFNANSGDNLSFKDVSFVINHCNFLSSKEYGLYSYTNNNKNDTITNTIFHNNGINQEFIQIYYSETPSLLVLKDNVVMNFSNYFNNDYSGGVYPGGNTYLSWNRVIVSNISSAEPLFVDNDFHNSENSVAVDHGNEFELDAHMPFGLGTQRSDAGMYGGPDNWFWGGAPPPDGRPEISTISDHPQDQGGVVGVQFDASAWDDESIPDKVSYYRLWRHYDEQGQLLDSVQNGSWEMVNEIPAQNFESYAIVTETIADSTEIGGDFYTCFLISAHTDAGEYWNSDHSCGYSIDNIAPLMPEGMEGRYAYDGGLSINWDYPTDADYMETHIYSNGELIGNTTDVTFFDENAQDNNIYNYDVYHLDISGNQSLAGQIEVSSMLPKWDVSQSQATHHIAIPKDFQIFTSNDPFDRGDFLGVFYDNEGVLECGGMVQWSDEDVVVTAYGNTDTSSGFSSNDEFIWRFWDASKDEYYHADVTYDSSLPNTSLFSVDGLSALVSVDVYAKQIIDLPQGWSMVSSYVMEDNPLLTSLFASVSEDIFVLKDENGAVYWPAYNFNDIGDLSDDQGYKLLMHQANSITFKGSKVIPNEKVLNLEQGWQIIPYLREKPASAQVLLENVSESIVIVKDDLGHVYWPEWDVNTIGNLIPGKAYQVKMMNDRNYNYPANFLELPTEQRLGNAEPEYFIVQNRTENNMTLGIPIDAWDITPNIFDEIAVTDFNDRVVGSSVFNGDDLVITIWADDEYSSEKEGLTEGESFHLKYRDQSSDATYSLNVISWEQGASLYGEDEIAIVSLIELGDLIDQDFHVYPVVPNPSANYSQLQLFSPKSNSVSIKIYNILGEIVYSDNIQIQEGIYQYDIPSLRFENGTYKLMVETSDKLSVQTIQIIR